MLREGPSEALSNEAASKAPSTSSLKSGYATLPRKRRSGGEDVLWSVDETPRGGGRGLRTGCVV